MDARKIDEAIAKLKDPRITSIALAQAKQLGLGLMQQYPDATSHYHELGRRMVEAVEQAVRS